MSASSVTKPKKSVKHSKKFQRTQTGCLQCRQKKKKCDGNRPRCDSCSKRNLCCEFPANIRVFQFQSFNNSEGDQRIKKEIIIDNSSISGNKSGSSESNSTKKSGSTSPKKKAKQKTDKEDTDRYFKQKPFIMFKSVSEPHSSTIKPVESPSLVKTSSISSTVSVSSSESAPELDDDTSTITSSTSSHPELEEEDSDSDDTGKALELANQGESINTELNNITIDLIKRAISNLNYIDLDAKLDNYYNGLELKNVFQVDSSNTEQYLISAASGKPMITSCDYSLEQFHNSINAGTNMGAGSHIFKADEEFFSFTDF